jgi:integrase
LGIDERLREFEDYLTLNTTSSHLTVKSYLSVIRRMILSLGLDFNITQINEWLKKQNHNKNCYHYKYAIRHFLICIGKKNLIGELSPSKVKQRKKLFRFVPKDKMEKVINSLSGRFKRIAFLQIKTGARISEILTLRAENIDFNIDPNMIYIKVGVGKSKTKGSKEGNLYLSKKYEPLLRSWMPRPYGYMFLDKVNDKDSDEILYRKIDTLTRAFNTELSKAGNWNNIEGLSSHYLRHLYSDYFLKAGGDPIYLKEALRHSKIDTTMKYVSIQEQMVKKVIHAMED